MDQSRTIQIEHFETVVQLDDVIGQAQAVSSNLGDQRRIFENIGNKLVSVSSKFPLVNGVLNSIRRKKSRVSIQSMQVLPCLISWLDRYEHSFSSTPSLSIFHSHMAMRCLIYTEAYLFNFNAPVLVEGGIAIALSRDF